MISMENWATQAIKKISEEKKAVAGNKEKAMSGAVFAAIKDFCLQDEEFAQAVVQGGTFADCMKKVASGVGNSISDLDAYKKAVQFYFPGAEVKMQLTIDLIGKAAGAAEGGRMMEATCKLGERGCWNDGKCRAMSNCENKIATNADRIRAMSDEELCEFLMRDDVCDQKTSPDCTDCEKCVMDWLQQPAEEVPDNA